MKTESKHGRGRGRPRRPLSVDLLVSTAVAMIDRDGLDGFSMRRLGQELGVDPMACYRHVPSKDALLDAVVEKVLAEVVPPDAGDPLDMVADGWRSFRQTMLEHPCVFPLVANRHVGTAGAVRPIETMLEMLTAAGLDAEQALHAFLVLLAYTTGALTNHLATLPPPVGQTTLIPQEDIASLPPDDFPVARALGPTLVDTDYDAEFDYGLDLIVDRLRTLTRSKADPA
jgi:AcrR family transcriptional regulator